MCRQVAETWYAYRQQEQLLHASEDSSHSAASTCLCVLAVERQPRMMKQQRAKSGKTKPHRRVQHIIPLARLCLLSMEGQHCHVVAAHVALPQQAQRGTLRTGQTGITHRH